MQDSGIYCKKWNLIVIMIFLLVYNDMKLRIFVFSLLLNEPHYLQRPKTEKKTKNNADSIEISDVQLVAICNFIATKPYYYTGP